MIAPPYDDSQDLAFKRGKEHNITVKRHQGCCGMHYQIDVTVSNGGGDPFPQVIAFDTKEDLLAMQEAINKALAIDAEYPEGTKPPQLQYW